MFLTLPCPGRDVRVPPHPVVPQGHRGGGRCQEAARRLLRIQTARGNRSVILKSLQTNTERETEWKQIC